MAEHLHPQTRTRIRLLQKTFFFFSLQWRGAGASHCTWIIKTERTPLLFCRVSAQSLGKVEAGDTVLKGAGNENKLVLQMKERCGVEIGWQARGWSGIQPWSRGWEWIEMDSSGRIDLWSYYKKRDWYLRPRTEKSIMTVRVVEKTLGFLLRHHLFLSWRRYSVLDYSFTEEWRHRSIWLH